MLIVKEDNEMIFNNLEKAKEYYEPTDFMDERDDINAMSDIEFKAIYLEWLDYREAIRQSETYIELQNTLNKYTDIFSNGQEVHFLEY